MKLFTDNTGMQTLTKIIAASWVASLILTAAL